MKKGLLLFAISATILIGCEKTPNKQLEVSPDSIELSARSGWEQITTNVDDAIFSSDDEFYASVDNNGKVSANKAGETTIRVSSSCGSASIPVKVIPIYYYYPDLDGLVGKGLSEITALMGSNYTSDGTQINYVKPNGYVDGMAFTMENGKCTLIVLAISNILKDVIIDHLDERYASGTWQGNKVYLNHDKKVAIIVRPYNNLYFSVSYFNM